MKFISLLSISSFALLLAACGGGGGESSSSPTSTPTFTSVSTAQGANVVKTIVNHSVGDPNTGPFTIAVGTETDFVTVTPSSLTSFTVNNNHGSTQTINAAGMLSGGIVDISSGATKTRIGGTQFTYTRFGTFLATLSNTNGLNSQYTERNGPFAMGTNYTANGITGTYANGGKAVGTLTMAGVGKVEVVCNVSIGLVVTGSTNQATLTLSSCDASGNAIPVSGTLRNTLGGGINSVTIPTPFTMTYTNGGTVTTVTGGSIGGARFMMSGPSADELVGSMTVNATASTGGINTSAIFNFAYGAKK